MFVFAFQLFFWIIVYNTAKFYVKSQTTVIHMNFSEDARFYRVLPRSDEYYIDSLILPSVILCTLECNTRKPLCVGVLYNSNSTTCKLLRFYLTQVNVFRQEYEDNWKYYPMKLGVSDGMWFLYLQNMHWYFNSKYKVNWREAKEECRLRKSYLVELTDIGENDFIRQNFFDKDVCDPNEPYRCTLWIGLNDNEVEGLYRWDNSNLTITFSNWYGRQPDGSDKKNCVDMLADGGWNDRGCRYDNSFVCEMV